MATLADVIDRMKQEGDLDRNSGTNSIKSLKESITVGLGSLERSVMALRQSMVNSNIAIRNLGENLKEQTAADQASQALKDPKPPESKGLSNLIGTLKDLTKSFGNFAKKLVPSRGGFLAAVLGGLAGLALFFPDWLEENIIDPIVDLFLGGTETWLGKVRSYIESTFNFIKDNFGEEAAWVAALAAGIAFLNPLTTGTIMFKALAGLGKLAGSLVAFAGVEGDVTGKARGGLKNLLRSIGRFAGRGALPVLAAAAIYGLVRAMEVLAGKNAENDIKRLADLRAEADNAAAEGDKARLRMVMDQINKIEKRAEELGGEPGRIIREAAAEARAEVGPLFDAIVKGSVKVGETTTETLSNVQRALQDELLNLNYSGLDNAAERFAKIEGYVNQTTDAIIESEEFRKLSAEEQIVTLSQLRNRNRQFVERARMQALEGLSPDERTKLEQSIVSLQRNIPGQDLLNATEGVRDAQVRREKTQFGAGFFGPSASEEFTQYMLDYVKVNTQFQQRALDLIDERALQPPGSGGGVNVNAPSVRQGDSNDNRQTQITNNNYTTYQNSLVANPAALF